MNRLTALLLVFVCVLSTSAQQPIRAVTVQLTTITKGDTNQVITIIERAKSYWYSNPDTAIILAQRGRLLSNQFHYKSGAAHCLYVIGNAYSIQGKFLLSIQYCLQSLQLAQLLSDRKLIADNFNSIGVSYYMQSNYVRALEYHLKALKEREVLNDPASVATSFDNIGIVYNEEGNYSQALNYHFKALEIEKRLPNKKDIAITLVNIGCSYLEQKNFDSALEAFSKASQTFEEIHDNFDLGTCLINIASIYLDQKKYRQALVYASKAQKIAEAIQDNAGIAANLKVIAQIHQKTGNLAESQSLALKSLALAHKIGIKILIQENSIILSDNYKRQGNFRKALEYNELANATRDSIFNMEKTKAISSLQTDYQLDKKELQIKSLNKDKIVQQQKLVVQQQRIANQDFQRNALIIGLILLTVLAFTVVGNIRQKQKISELRTQQKIADIIHLSSHKVRGPIASILGLATLYNKNIPDDPFNQEVIDNIEVSAKKLDAIVHDAVFTAHQEIDKPGNFTHFLSNAGKDDSLTRASKTVPAQMKAGIIKMLPKVRNVFSLTILDRTKRVLFFFFGN